MYFSFQLTNTFVCLAAILVLGHPQNASAADWPVFGRDGTRNSVVPEGRGPTDWDLTSRRNIKWTATLGSSTFAAPVVAQGRVYIGTNNGAGYLERYSSKVDLGCLLCFRESDGQFMWQYSAEKLPIGRVHDWPMHGLVSSPLVEKDRLWFVSNRHNVVCLDAHGFRDGDNDGPFVDEPVSDSREADVIWQVDLIKELGADSHTFGEVQRGASAQPVESRSPVIVLGVVDARPYLISQLHALAPVARAGGPGNLLRRGRRLPDRIAVFR
jgi:hypothetical protein